MPIRITPVYRIGPCLLNLNSIQEISALVERDLLAATYSARDNVWEIYDEPRGSFLREVSKRDKLDSFILKASSDDATDPRRIELVFNEKEATVSLTASPEYENWFEHFLIDLKKHIHRPSLSQILIHVFGRGELYFRFPLLIIPLSSVVEFTTPYCRIVIRKRRPDPFLENIKANLVSNLIWALIGVIVLLVVQWVFRKYGIDLNPFD